MNTKLLNNLVCGFIGLIIVACSSGSSSTVNSNSLPDITANNLNLFFIASMEEDPATANLSVTGLNQSLLFAQNIMPLLSNNGGVAQIYALMPGAVITNNYPDISSLQTIEHLAVINFMPVTVTLESNVNTNIQIIQQIINTQKSGNYFFAMPAQLINQTLATLKDNGLNFNFQPINANGQDILISITQTGQVSATLFQDKITPSTQFPSVSLITEGNSCLQAPYTYSTPTGAAPANINTNETVYFIRHVEAHPYQNFDNGNYVPQGVWRAFGIQNILADAINWNQSFLIYAPDPGTQIQESTGYNYVRGALSVTPYAIGHNVPLNLVNDNVIHYKDSVGLMQYLFLNGKFSNKTLLVSWEHHTINVAVDNLIMAFGQNVPLDFPVWQSSSADQTYYEDYDTIWQITLDNNGNMYFSNTCEHVWDGSLPLTPPLF